MGVLRCAEQSAGKGQATKGAVKCGKCPPCLRPSMRKACLRPLIPSDAVDVPGTATKCGHIQRSQAIKKSLAVR